MLQGSNACAPGPSGLPASGTAATVAAMPYSPQDRHPPADIRFGEFVALMALLMALTALSIDIMLVALPQIAADYAVDNPNHRQLVVTCYMLGFAASQPFHGPLSDRFGRKPVLTAGLVVFAIGTVAAMLAPSFELHLAGRALQGIGAAAPRIVAVAVVRDRFAGRDMARVMSFVMTIFIIVPVLAPSIGEVVLWTGHWSWIFGFLLLAAAVALVWSSLRLKETRPAGDRLPLSAAALGGAYATILTSRRSFGYTVASGFMFGALMSYVTSAQQIFVDVYGLGDLFPVVFGAIAAAMAVASITNARLVGRLGMRRVSHTAMLGYVAACVALAVAGFPPHLPLPFFCAFLAATFFAFGLMVPNFNAMAMEPLGHIAGVGSSFIGFYTTATGAVLGWIIGQSFDGTVRPITIGFSCFGIATLLSVLVTERGQLLKAREQQPRS